MLGITPDWFASSICNETYARARMREAKVWGAESDVYDMGRCRQDVKSEPNHPLPSCEIPVTILD